ncbi:MAG: DNA mismatch repair endonuclease MutL [Alistipes finegoldii]
MAQVELRTRQEGDEVGTQTEINGGQFAGQTPVMCPVGSQFSCATFSTTCLPARRRFLDKSTTSAAQIKAEFQRVALCNPHIAFELYANDAPVYTLCATSLAGRIVDVVGRHIKQNLLEVDADTSIARIGGYIGRPAAAKRRNGEQYLFVNGRYFKSSYLTSAIMKAYEKLIPESSSPSYFLYLTIDPSRIDVNVHPQKTEVKFADEEAVWQIVNAAVRETLAKTGAVPLMDFDREGIVEIPVLTKGPSTASRGPCPTANTILSAKSTSTRRRPIRTSISPDSTCRSATTAKLSPTMPARACSARRRTRFGCRFAGRPAQRRGGDFLRRQRRRRIFDSLCGGRRLRGFRVGRGFEVTSESGFDASELEFIPPKRRSSNSVSTLTGGPNLPIRCRSEAAMSPPCWADGSWWWTCAAPVNGYFTKTT